MDRLRRKTLSSRRRIWCKGLVLLVLLFCLGGSKQPAPPLFELLSPDRTGIDFENTMVERPGSNVLESEFFFNGGGVAVGDINNDGFSDLYFTANTGPNALYLNNGNLEFENITGQAGLRDSGGWSAGTSIVDINGDGLLDIYVCKSGEVEEDLRRNKLYINNGDHTFSEKAAAYGLDDPGYCTQASFFDYDRDGDLDTFIVNYSVKTHTGFNIVDIRKEVDPLAGDRLYRNDQGTFTDVSEQAGLVRNPISFGLNVSISDVNSDGWPDMLVTNDFMEKDYLYINQQDGSFREEITSRTHLTSYFSMGSDIADINNDGLPDMLVVDMLPYDYTRRRVFKTPNYNLYTQRAMHGYHRQNMRNTLQLNRGDGTFTEMGRLAGISSTDWSWSSLLTDLDNDGHKDVYITNGFPRFYTDLDYLNEVLWEEFPEEQLTDNSELLYELVQKMEKAELHNFAFKNEGDLTFSDRSGQWGLDQHAVSSGAAYADLDNNGSLELIVNNINEQPFVFKNNLQEVTTNNYLKVRLQGAGNNTFGIGAKVRLTGEKSGEEYFQENYPVRGYQASVDPTLLFGVGQNEQVTLTVTWPDESQEVIEDVPVNQVVTLRQEDARGGRAEEKSAAVAEQAAGGGQASGSSATSAGSNGTSEGGDEQATGSSEQGVGINSAEDPLASMFLALDFSALGFEGRHRGSGDGQEIRTPLKPHATGNAGPALARGDINQDGLADLFVGGGPDQVSSMYLQQSDGAFSRNLMPGLTEHKGRDDVDALFFDSNGNGQLDLYVVSGHSESKSGSYYQDRLYLNDGFGRFVYASDALPRMEVSGGTVLAFDMDEDGDRDLFVGGRNRPNQYPKAPRSYVLENNNGRFTDVTRQMAPELERPGMVTDAAWADINRDGRKELLVTGEWMPIRVFSRKTGRTFEEITASVGLENSSGWWNVLKVADLDGDGWMDLVAGNRGLNTFLEAFAEEPVLAYSGDFNGDGFTEPLLSQVVEGERYPVAGRDAYLGEFPELEEGYPDYRSFATATMSDILGTLSGSSSQILPAHTMASAVFKNRGDGSFQMVPLPNEAQLAPIYDMIVSDFDGDSIPDILAVGNNFATQSRNGPVAGEGAFLIGAGDFTFTALQPQDTGFRGAGEVRNMAVVPHRYGPLIMLGRYDESIVPYLYQGE